MYNPIQKQAELFADKQGAKEAPDYKEAIKRALDNQESIVYYALCSQLGIQPTDKTLYEEGNIMSSNRSKSDLQEIVNNPNNFFSFKRNSVKLETSASTEKPIKERKRFVSKEWYTYFLNEAGHYIKTDFGEYTTTKINILRKYFEKFRVGGKQNLERYDNIKVGSIFKHLYDTYSKR
jgi:hypothetical protein